MHSFNEKLIFNFHSLVYILSFLRFLTFPKLISNKQTVIIYGSHFWKHFSCISVRYDREITLALYPHYPFKQVMLTSGFLFKFSFVKIEIVAKLKHQENVIRCLLFNYCKKKNSRQEVFLTTQYNVSLRVNQSSYNCIRH